MTKARTFPDVWDALESSPEEAATMTMRSDVMIAINEKVRSWDTTQARAARRLGITQPRLNDLLHGKINKFSLDADDLGDPRRVESQDRRPVSGLMARGISKVAPVSASRAFSLGPLAVRPTQARPAVASTELNGVCPVSRLKLDFISSPAVASRAPNTIDDRG
jgi:predicted XRE-type DNA-binding protein